MKTLLIIGYTWPEPASTAAGNRMVQLIQFFRQESFNIVFASTAEETELSMNLDVLGIRKQRIVLNHSDFDDFVTTLDPKIVLYDRFLTEEQFGWRVAQCVPQALRILDTEDLHSLRKSRENAIKKGVPFTASLWLNEDITKREIASCYRCDLILVISSYEMQLLIKVIKMDEALLLHLPFMFDSMDGGQLQGFPSFQERQHFICIGNGRHAPNVDAVIWLKETLWPSIRKILPQAELHTYGSYLPKHVQQMHDKAEGFLVKGHTKDALKTMANYRVNLAPLRFGAGIKGKLTDAMRTGTPSITTKIGAEGMHGKLPWNGYIADTPRDFVQSAVALYQDPVIWKEAQQNGIKIINDRYSKTLLQKVFCQKINLRLKDVQGHRSRNFIGAMLLHQTLNANKYKSKWIEVKNKGC